MREQESTSHDTKSTFTIQQDPSKDSSMKQDMVLSPHAQACGCINSDALHTGARKKKGEGNHRCASKNFSMQAPRKEFSARHQAPRHNMCARNTSTATVEGRAPSQRAHNHWAPREDEGTFSEYRQSPGTKKSSASAFPQMRAPANTCLLFSPCVPHTPLPAHNLYLLSEETS